MQIYLGRRISFVIPILCMALEAYGYDLRPEYLEDLDVDGEWGFHCQEHPLVFFDNGMPDL